VAVRFAVLLHVATVLLWSRLALAVCGLSAGVLPVCAVLFGACRVAVWAAVYCAVLCWAMLGCTVLHCAVLCCAVPRRTALHCTAILSSLHAELCCIMLCCAVCCIAPAGVSACSARAGRHRHASGGLPALLCTVPSWREAQRVSSQLFDQAMFGSR
jgi:hypothetical protein